MSRTSDRSRGSCERSMSVQLPLAVWLAISARSAADHPAASSAMACLRVRGSVDTEEATSAHSCPRTPSEATSKERWRR
eukprot:6185738-Pleurochrysis_carterae.AAC.2